MNEVNDNKATPAGNPEAEENTIPTVDAGAAAHDLELAPEIKQLQADLDQARAEAAELLDRLLRAKAEVENTRKRAQADVASAHKYALERFAAEIIAVRDSLELARMVELPADSSPAVQKMHEGLDLTLKLMDSIFQKFGLTRLDPRGEKFDPERHQAISLVEAEEVPPNHVVNVVQKGYLLNDRLLRPAMVVIRGEPAAKKGAEQT
ncbi:MAG: nucleotide exchange factor GrpE [Sulfuricaulis sp.]|uniref:nucleotide exchange factor GrpE n=1 Tax=Sulfuricaulis sp. TaxID=2003553 RepID=UPI0034A53A4F